jgi:hypothetical protein
MDNHAFADIAQSPQWQRFASKCLCCPLLRKKRPIRELRLFITRQKGDVAKRLAVDAALGYVVSSVSFLEEVDEVVDGGIKDLQVTAEIEAENTGVAQEPDLGLLCVF